MNNSSYKKDSLFFTYSLNPNFIEENELESKLDMLYHKYEQLQLLYYSMYIESFSNLDLSDRSITYIHLYNNFKCVCRLLNQIKNLVNTNQKTPMLGVNEIKLLIGYSDIKNFLDKNDLYPIIESNYS
ncbi:hypothetical protein WIV_gp127 [Wiseana iridescent virus]|uniref:Uncharacterized protein n=1 Tax=Wiseana iridescent virus TaxID=68347 RepID=G0T5F3_IRV9|nr:hypothetical protein WIV_gp127 [Wiseana iridescent virus]ADO00471.1 hypothetical protein [Wiseana iridescent virus]